jgi:hypothetical protein
MLEQQRYKPLQIQAVIQPGWYASAIGFKHTQLNQELDGLALGVWSQARLYRQSALGLVEPPLLSAQSARPIQQLRHQDRCVAVPPQGANQGRPNHHHALTAIPVEESPHMLVKLVPWIAHARGSAMMRALVVLFLVIDAFPAATFVSHVEGRLVLLRHGRLTLQQELP